MHFAIFNLTAATNIIKILLKKRKQNTPWLHHLMIKTDSIRMFQYGVNYIFSCQYMLSWLSGLLMVALALICLVTCYASCTAKVKS